MYVVTLLQTLMRHLHNRDKTMDYSVKDRTTVYIDNYPIEGVTAKYLTALHRIYNCATSQQILSFTSFNS